MRTERTDRQTEKKQRQNNGSANLPDNGGTKIRSRMRTKIRCLDKRCLVCDEDEVKDNDEDAKEVGEVDVFVQRLRGLLGRATRH